MIVLKIIVGVIVAGVALQYILYFCENVVDGCDDDYKRSFKDIKKAYLKAEALKKRNSNVVEITIETRQSKWQRLQISLFKMHPSTNVFYERKETLCYCPASFIGSILFNLYFKNRLKNNSKLDNDSILDKYLELYNNSSQE